MGIAPLIGVWIALAQVPANSDDAALVDSILTAYEANRASLAAFGTVEYRSAVGAIPVRDGTVLDQLPEATWGREAATEGTYLFEGPYAYHDHSYSIEQIVNRRNKVSENTWSSDIQPFKELLNGTADLMVCIGAEPDGKTPVYTESLFEGPDGVKRFTSWLPVPLVPGRQEPADYDLGVDIRRARAGHADWLIHKIDPDAQIDGTRVVRLSFINPNSTPRYIRHYWVDLEHGAIPLRIRDDVGSEGRGYQYDFGDVRRVGERAWLPYHKLVFLYNIQGKRGNVGVERVWEVVITKADFQTPPDHSKFKIEFPNARAIISNTTNKRFPAHKVWDLDAISPASASRAQPVPVGLPAAEPVMPGEREPSSPWAFPLMVMGVILLAAVGGVALYRRRRHA